MLRTDGSWWSENELNKVVSTYRENYKITGKGNLPALTLIQPSLKFLKGNLSFFT